MSKPKVKTSPNLGDTSPAHQKAIADGEKHFRAWEYNVADHFKDHTVDEIKWTLKDTAFPFAVMMENWIGDFNFSSLVRNANGFNAEKVFYLGVKKWDKRGAQGVYNYTDVNFISSIDELIKLKERYVFVGVDNVVGSIPLSTYIWAPNSLMIFGSEGTGLTPEVQAMCQDLVSIPMYGSVRSFNCSSASAVVMYDYVSKYTAT
jgi:tRNA G18 (ribose-2'-O)-methylase SpoU